MPNVSLVEFSVVPFWATDVASVYSGWAPSWYGHQTCGFVIVRLGNALGVNVTVCVVLAGTVTFWVTVTGAPLPGGVTATITPPGSGAPVTVTQNVTGAPLPGGVIVAVTVPAWAVVVFFVMSVFTVSAELLR